MSIILGLNANHADSSECLMYSGELLFRIEEEKINRIKHWSRLSIKIIQACLKSKGVDSSEIIDISLNINPLSNFGRKVNFFCKKLYFRNKKIWNN
jgi:hypothetical protein